MFFVMWNPPKIHQQQNNAKKYDIIIMDGFDQGYCSPENFFNRKFVLKLREQLTPNGVLGLNTLPGCHRHQEEILLYTNVFDNYFISDIVLTNRIIFGLNGKTPHMKQIKINAKSFKNSFSNLLNVNTEWIIEKFHFDAKRAYGVCDYFLFVKQIFFITN